jgi:putative CocE/NonD family hydrolase
LITADLKIPVRDGVVLVADLHQAPVEGRRPVLLIRTPYGRQGYRDEPFVGKAVERGYAVVVQDVRGRYESAGVFDPYQHEGLDGYDTIEWLAAQRWSTGRIATAGLSYPGAVQWLTAVEAPPHLVCAFPAMCFSSGRQFFYFGGAFDLSWLPWTAINVAPDARRRRSVDTGPLTVAEARTWWKAHGRDALRRVPLRDQPALEDAAPFYFDWLDHPDDGSFWHFADIEGRHRQVRVPIFNFSGWHDEGYGPIGATRNYAGLRARAAADQARHPRLMIGPWVHGAPHSDTHMVGDRDFGKDAGLDYDTLVLDWCDRHARGIDSETATDPPVRLFVMGANRWREEADWPVPSTPRAYYLRSGGRLTTDPPLDGEPAERYTFDPAKPVEDPHYDAGLGPHDQREVESRSDVLVYSTPPLAEDLEVIGGIECRLWIASSALDTDFYCRLLDVEPDGAAWNLMSPTLEVLRAKYRGNEEEPVLLVPGQPVELVFRLPLTANRFLRGHRIRVHVTSSFFPHLDRNPNTGQPSAADGRLLPARQTVFHDSGRPSRVILPVVSEPRI